jgi:subtilisin family serine protease
MDGLTISFRFLITAVLATGGFLAGPVVVTPREIPTHRVYHGEEEKLAIDSGRLAVLFTSESRSPRRDSTLKAIGIEVAMSRPTGVAEWQLLTLKSPLSGAPEIDSRIRELIASGAVEFASPVFRRPDGGWSIVTPSMLVRLSPEYIEMADVLLRALAPGMEVVERDFAKMSGVYELRGDSRNGFDLLALANALARDPHVVWAEPVWQFSARAGMIPDDAGFGNLWGMVNTGQFGGVPGMDMDADLAWDITTGAGVKVMVLDDGVQSDHPDLNWGGGQDFTTDGSPDGNPYNECDNHGTIVAGCVAALMNNALGTVGIAPSASVLGARFAISTVPCDGTGAVLSSWVVNALEWGASEGVRVSNTSWGIGSAQVVADKYNETYDNGMVHFACAGNGSGTSVWFPASLEKVNAVANVRPEGVLAPSSCYGPLLSVSAPGSQIYMTDRTGSDGYVDGDYAFNGGTSFASPYAAGIAALILSLEPSLSASEVEQKLRCSARDLGEPGFDETFGHGFVNAYRAVLAPVGVDSDTDGTEDACDNCPNGANMDQADADQDGIGDVCDACADDWYNDLDGDGHCTRNDNCPYLANPGQDDVNDDGVGDVCACAAARFVFTGEAAGDAFGWRARGAGDVNNDGFGDLIVGAPQNDTAASNAGTVWIYSGADGAVLYTITGGAANDRFGRSVTGMGDVNGDGLDDFAVSAHLNSSGPAAAGRAYVFLGRPGPYPVSLSAGNAFYNLTGEAAGDSFGISIASTRDVDADGVRELLVGAWNNDAGGADAGRAYLFSGADGAPIHTWNGPAAGDQFGWEVADAGDVNGDGITDVIVGAYLNDAGGTDAGGAYVYSGSTGALLFSIHGEAEEDWLGISVAGAGDLNGDDYDDVIVGASENDAAVDRAGRAYVFFGGPGPYPVVHGAVGADWILDGEEFKDRFGMSVSNIGDVNGDTVTDLAVGASNHGAVGRGRTGGAYVISGQTGDVLHTFTGEVAGDESGKWVDGNSDFDLDGMNDLIIGAFLNDDGGEDAGRVYVYFLGDDDADGFVTNCDNCPGVFNPDQEPIVFDQMIVASAPNTFSWTVARDIDWVRGNLAFLRFYATNGGGTKRLADSVTDRATPAVGQGFFYLVKLGGMCEGGSWQTVLGEESLRDALLP